VQRFGGVGRYIGENFIGGFASQKNFGGHFGYGSFTDLIECS
jgi:hypothetical protein